MFSPRIIEEKIDRVSLHLISKSPIAPNGNRLFLPGFRLQRHSIAQVSQANAHLESLFQIGQDGKAFQIRSYNTDELRWMRNERELCRCDFLYWATRYAFIKDIEDRVIRFTPNLPQQIILDVFGDMESREIALLVQILKARQEGVTTLSELIVLWKTMMFPGTTSRVGSSRPDKTVEMVQKMDLCYRNQPEWLVPKIITNNKDVIGFDAQDSFINLSHGAVMSGLGRGGTTTTFHLSEVSGFLNPNEDIDAALLRAVHDSPWILGILESTGDGRAGWWYDKWQYNAAHWDLGQSRICPIFLPWYLMVDLYPTRTWLKGHPIPKNHIFADLTIAHANRAKEYVQSGENKVVSRILGSNWEMPPEQMYFWEITRQEYAANKELHVFYQELCADDKEAFQNANPSVFDSELIYNLRENTPRPVGVYGILASQAEIPVQLQAKEGDIDHALPPIDITAAWNPLQPKHNYRLVPLLHHGAAPFNPLGKIIMYEKPRPGDTYGLGTDTGFGIGQDRTVIEVIRKGSATRGVAQVCEFASPNMNSFAIWPINLALGTLYSTSIGGRIRQARQVIEGAANGENVFNELKKRGWREFHNWVRYDRKRIVESAANRQLWYTNSWSRPLALDMLLDAINNGWLDITSPWFVEEMADLELDENRMRLQAASGKHDDRIMAMAIVLFSMHAMDTKHIDSWISRKVDTEGVVVYPKYSPGVQGNVPPPGNDKTSSYTYRVINSRDPDVDRLKDAGPMIWTPKV